MIGGVLHAETSPFLPVQAGKTGPASPDGTADAATAASGQSGGKTGKKAGAGPADTLTLSPEAEQEVARLQQVDTSVRQHEAAHQAAGGPYAGGASFQFQRGPDGKNYAVAGEVPVDLSREGTPEATIAKMEVVKAAALAPADPSGQDRSIASQADSIIAEARREIAARRNGELEKTLGGSAGKAAGEGGFQKADEAGGQGGIGKAVGESLAAAKGDEASGAGNAANRRAAGAYNAAALIGTIAAGERLALSV